MNLNSLVFLSFICVLLSDIVVYLSGTIGVGMDATYIISILRLVSLLCLLIFSSKISWGTKIPKNVLLLFKVMIVWNIITFVRGAFTAEDYWDWKVLFLGSLFTFLIPYALVIGVLFYYADFLFSFIIRKIFLLGFIIIPLTMGIDPERELFAKIMLFVCLFLLFAPYFKQKWLLLTFLVTLVSLITAYDFRANLMRILFAAMLVPLYYAKSYIKNSWLKVVSLSLFLIPFLFLFLGLTEQFNIFKPFEITDQYVTSYDNGKEVNLAADTRTLLYEEVFHSMMENNSFIYGEGGTGKYKSEVFDSLGDERGRYGAEVGFLNTLLYSGMVGVLLYGLMLFFASSYAIGHSNNFLCKMLGLFIAFRWVLFFIEDITKYDLNFYFLWLAIGLCLSKEFRSMSDTDIKLYFRKITETQYIFR